MQVMISFISNKFLEQYELCFSLQTLLKQL